MLLIMNHLMSLLLAANLGELRGIFQDCTRDRFCAKQGFAQMQSYDCAA